jgi:putative ABC transport system substrate-binding protein
MRPQMQRREFITLLGGAAALWPLTPHAQQSGTRRIGVLANLDEGDPEDREEVGVFRKHLEQLGWVEGRNIEVEIRRTVGSPDRARAFAAELVGLKPEAILVIGGTAAVALQRETRSLPIVFVTDTDPVAAGWVPSLARPGGNVTGFTFFERSLGPKWLELLKQIAPEVARVTILSADNPQSRVVLPTIEAALPSFGLLGTVARVHDATEIEQAIDIAAREPNTGLVVLASTVAYVHRESIIARASRYRLPSVYTNSVFCRSGGLLSYGTDRADQFRKAANYVDRILRGDKAADLPVQTPTKFEMVVNLKTARALGISLPPLLLAIADEVIE